MNARYPESNTTSSEEGTAAHWVLADRLDRTDNFKEGQLTPNGIAVTDEMIQGAEMVREVIDACIPHLDLHVEETVTIPAIHPDCFGTPDVWAYDAVTTDLHIIDYKFGHGFVDEYRDPQGLLLHVGIIGGLPLILTTVSFTIVQPRCFYRGQPYVPTPIT